jgi:hypothetical protein
MEVIEKQQFMSEEAIKVILDRTQALQDKAGYDGNYQTWVEQNTPLRLENLL